MAGESSLAERIERALTEAMKARDRIRVSTLRMVRAALKNREIEARGPLPEDEVIQVLATQVKQRREAIEQFRSGGREDLVAGEEAELAVLQEFLPRELPEDELRQMVRQAIAEADAREPRDLGRVMKVLMPRVRGRADGRRVNDMVRSQLAGDAP